MPPHKRDSPEELLPASGVPANADRLLPAMMAARTAVSCAMVGDLIRGSFTEIVG